MRDTNKYKYTLRFSNLEFILETNLPNGRKHISKMQEKGPMSRHYAECGFDQDSGNDDNDDNGNDDDNAEITEL